MIDFLKQRGQKAYREIRSILDQPEFLFSNDRELIRLESSHNLRYIHGLNKLIKNHKISNEEVKQIFLFIEDSIKKYLRGWYENKPFVYYVKADALIPAFVIWVASYHDSKQIEGTVPLEEIINWYYDHACFDGLSIIESSEEDLEDSEEEPPEIAKLYVNVITT
jgi:hypothetical protein